MTTSCRGPAPRVRRRRRCCSTGLTVLLLGAGALWLAAAMSRRLEGTRLKAQAAGAVAALRRRPSPRPHADS